MYINEIISFPFAWHEPNYLLTHERGEKGKKSITILRALQIHIRHVRKFILFVVFKLDSKLPDMFLRLKIWFKFDILFIQRESYKMFLCRKFVLASCVGLCIS